MASKTLICERERMNQKDNIRSADKSLARPGRKQTNVSVRMACISFGALPCRGGKNLMTARVSMLLKSRSSLACFRACFLPGRAKNLLAPLCYAFELQFCNLCRPGAIICSEDLLPYFIQNLPKNKKYFQSPFVVGPV